MPISINQFKQILVCVDLADEKRFVSNERSRSTQEAIDQAVWLAKSNRAELCLFYVLPLSAEQRSHDGQILMAEGNEYKSVHDDASEVLAEIAKKVSKQKIKASSKVVFGKPWIEIIREVVGGKFDLVIAGTRNQGPFRGMLFGSTGIKLLRKCPCPVWITKPADDDKQPVESILVAHDFTLVGDTALELGCSLARSPGVELHVLHALENHVPVFDESTSAFSATKSIDDQLAQLGMADKFVSVHVADGHAEEGILTCVKKFDINLLIMGTIARAGINGMLVGNTAEHVLPFLPCSILAIKPDGFKCPVSLEDKKSSYV